MRYISWTSLDRFRWENEIDLDSRIEAIKSYNFNLHFDADTLSQVSVCVCVCVSNINRQHQMSMRVAVWLTMSTSIHSILHPLVRQTEEEGKKEKIV